MCRGYAERDTLVQGWRRVGQGGAGDAEFGEHQPSEYCGSYKYRYTWEYVEAWDIVGIGFGAQDHACERENGDMLFHAERRAVSSGIDLSWGIRDHCRDYLPSGPGVYIGVETGGGYGSVYVQFLEQGFMDADRVRSSLVVSLH